MIVCYAMFDDRTDVHVTMTVREFEERILGAAKLEDRLADKSQECDSLRASLVSARKERDAARDALTSARITLQYANRRIDDACATRNHWRDRAVKAEADLRIVRQSLDFLQKQVDEARAAKESKLRSDLHDAFMDGLLGTCAANPKKPNPLPWLVKYAGGNSGCGVVARFINKRFANWYTEQVADQKDGADLDVSFDP